MRVFGRALLGVAVVVALAGTAAAPARAAQVTVDAPAACVAPASLSDEVSEIVGASLADVAEVDFQIRISQVGARKWHLHLETVGRHDSGPAASPARGARDIDAASCAELAEAAALAIAVSVRALTPVPNTTGSTSSRSPVAAVVPVSLPAPGTQPSAAPARPGVRPALALALTTDAGALPSPRPGVELEGSLGRGAWRLTLLAAWYASADAALPGGSGGTFQLAVGGALGCFAPRHGRWTPLACGGLELGRLAGTGLDVPRPRTGASLWRAARADAGVMAAVGHGLSAVVRTGVAAPFAQPAFALDGTDVVYRPGRLALRLTAGVELDL